MIELKGTEYSKVSQLLNIPEVNTLFAESVVCHQIDGTIYVDDRKIPSIAYIKHPYGMSFLVGESGNIVFNEALKVYLLNLAEDRHSAEWLQIYPCDWNEQMENILGSSLVKMPKGLGYQGQTETSLGAKVFQYERHNFTFDQNSFHKNRRRIPEKGIQIDTFCEEAYDTFGRLVTPRQFWNNYTEFCTRSLGFILLIDHKPVAVAFASFIIGNQWEIGVETKEEYRGRGYATIICSTLIDYCLDHGFTPVWSCHAGNLGSKNLAHQLGFKVSKSLPYYHLA